jgi:hypothetical protein
MRGKAYNAKPDPNEGMSKRRRRQEERWRVRHIDHGELRTKAAEKVRRLRSKAR